MAHGRNTFAGVVASTFALVLMPPAAASGGGAPETSPGYVIMIHSVAEPRSHSAVDATETGVVGVDQAITGISYASGAAIATRTGADTIIFHAIPYRADTVYPVVVREPRLEVAALDSDRRMMLEPNRPSAGPICESETSWAGNEGPIEACTAYEVPISALEGMNVITLTLQFIDAGGVQAKVHSFPAHFLLHMAIEGAPVDLQAVDAAITEPTPLVMQTLIETRAM